MLGVYFSGLHSFITEYYGQDVWDQIVSEDLENRIQYGKSENDFDDQLVIVISQLADNVGESPTALIKSFGRHLLPELLEFMPEARQGGMTFRSFMISIDRVIHKDIQRLYPEIRIPQIEFIQEANQLTMFYRSERKLCYLAEGLIEGAAEFFQASIELRHPICMHQGASYCEIEIVIY